MTLGRQRNSCVWRVVQVAAVAILLTATTTLWAEDEEKKPATSYQAFYLHNVTGIKEANDLQTTLRNMLPSLKLYFSPSTGAISVRGTDTDIQMTKQIIADLDRPQKTWRLTYTVTEIDGGNSGIPKRFSLTVAEGAKTFLKQGTKVPIVTGKYGSEHTTPETQVQYLDVGLNVEASLEGYENGLRLKTKFEQSAVADNAGAHADDPVIQQTTMETTSALEPGKEVALGSVAEPNSPHHVQVSVVAEAVK